MLEIICNNEQKDSVKQYFVKTMAELTEDTNLETLEFSYMDEDDLEDNIYNLIEDTDNGFIFDRNNMVGTEP